MKILDRVRFQHYVNLILSFMGIAGSFYIIGWVQHPNHVLVGTLTFIAFVVAIIITTINFYMVKKQVGEY